MSKVPIITTHQYTVDGLRLNVAETGQGPELVLIHGWSNNWGGWTPLAKQLALNFKLYMLDLPGFGDSDPLDHYDLDIEAHYINAFIVNQNLKPKAILGASLGTIISSRTLELYPHLTDHLILLGAVFNHLSVKKAALVLQTFLSLSDHSDRARNMVARTIKSRYTAYLFEKFLNAYEFDRKKVDRYSIPGRRKITGKSYVQLGLSGSNFILEDYLRDLDKQVLLIYGEAEKFVRPQRARQILKELNNPNLHLKILARSGHNPAYEQPEAASEAITSFLT